MQTVKMAGFVVLGALSLGTGAAMAQNEGFDEPGVPYWTLERQADALRRAEGRDANQVQATSSDTDVARPGISQSFGVTQSRVPVRP